MECKKCGHLLEEGTKFCPECGEAVEKGTVKVTENDKVEKAKAVINDFGGNMQKKEVEISGKKFNMLEVIIYGSGILAVLACFLPFISVSVFGYSESVSLMNGGDGIICIALAAAVCVLTFLHKEIIALGIAGIIAAFTIYEIINVKSVLGGYGGISLGAYLLIIAAVGLVAGTVLVYNNVKKTNGN